MGNYYFNLKDSKSLYAGFPIITSLGKKILSQGWNYKATLCVTILLTILMAYHCTLFSQTYAENAWAVPRFEKLLITSVQVKSSNQLEIEVYNDGTSSANITEVFFDGNPLNKFGSPTPALPITLNEEEFLDIALFLNSALQSKSIHTITLLTASLSEYNKTIAIP